MPELGLRPKGLADGGLGDLLVGQAQGAGVLEAGCTGAGHWLTSLGQRVEVAACLVKQITILGELLFVALDDMRRSFRNKTLIA